MTRLLGLFILSLHVLADIRHRFPLGITSALFAFIAGLSVVGIVAFHATSMPLLRDAAILTSKPSLPGRPAVSPTLGKSIGSPAVVPQRKSVQSNSPATNQTIPTGSVPASNVPPSSSSSGQASLTGAITLDQMQTSCSNGSQQLVIPTGHVQLSAAADKNLTLSMRWEVQPDAANNATTPLPAIKDADVPAGIQTIVMPSPDRVVPLLSVSAAELSADKYTALRLHIVAPFDAFSDWQSIAAVPPDGCPAPTQ